VVGEITLKQHLLFIYIFGDVAVIYGDKWARSEDDRDSEKIGYVVSFRIVLTSPMNKW